MLADTVQLPVYAILNNYHCYNTWLFIHKKKKKKQKALDFQFQAFSEKAMIVSTNTKQYDTMVD